MSSPDPPVDDVVAGRAGDVDADGQRRRVDIAEIGDIGAVARRLVGIAEIDGRRGEQQQRVVADAAIDRIFGAVIGDGVVAGAALK